MQLDKLEEYAPLVSPIQEAAPSKMYRIGVLTSGGDSAGMDCAIRAIVRETINRSCKCFLIKEGYTGLVEDKFEEANWKTVSDVMHRGGTMIGSSRCNDFKTRQGRKTAVLHLIKRKIFHLIVIGGDGTLTGATVLKDEWKSLVDELLQDGIIAKNRVDDYAELRVVGIIGSIDNDLHQTDKSLGSDTALARIVECVDILISTANSHQRIFVVEVMGRNCGYLALTTGIALEADFVIYPEKPPDEDWADKMCQIIERSRKIGKRNSLVILCEGAVDKAQNKINMNMVKEEITNRLKFEVRTLSLGHLQRGGSPTAMDRIMGTRLGYEATREVLRVDEYGSQLAGEKNVAKVLCMRGHRITKHEMKSAIESFNEISKKPSASGVFSASGEARGVEFINKANYLNFVSIPPSSDMPEHAKTFAVIHVGSPCAGMNAATMGFTRMASYSGIAVVGVQDGWDGFASGRYVNLTWSNVLNWTGQNGSLLGSKQQLPTCLEKISAAIDEKQIDALLIIGGFEAYISAKILTENRANYQAFNLPIAVIPASIANNVPGTCFSLGSDTALNEICRQIDNISCLANGSGKRAMIVELMGHRCGYLPTMSSIATGANEALIYQKAYEKKDIVKLAEEAKTRMSLLKRDNFLVIRGEGSNDSLSTFDMKKIFDKVFANDMTTRINMLGHAQVGGAPSCFDRQMGVRLGIRAFEGLYRPRRMGRRDSCLVGLRGNKISFTPIVNMSEMVCTKHKTPLKMWWLDLHPLVRHLSAHVEPRYNSVELPPD